MEKLYQIVLIEDSIHDAELIEQGLKKLSIDLEIKTIQKKKELLSCLENNPPHLIISDYTLTEFTGIEVLHIVRKRYPSLPFIFISGYIGEEKAVDIMLEGASDYAVKNNLKRLGAAVTRELQNYKQHLENKKKFEKVRQQQQSIVNSVDGIVWEANARTFKFNFVSPQVQRLLGYTPKEWLNTPNFWQEHIHPNDRQRAVTYCHYKTRQGENHEFEYRMRNASNEYVWLRDYVTVISQDGEPDQLRGIMVDISEQKNAERQRDKAYQIANIGHWELDIISEELYWSDAVKKLHEVDLDYIPDLDSAISFYKEGADQRRIRDAINHTIKTSDPFEVELPIITAEGNQRWIRAIGEAKLRDGKCVGIFGSTQDITERKETEQKLRDVVEHSTNMFYRHDTGHELTYVSPQAVDFLGCSRDEAMRRWTEFLTDHPINKIGWETTQKAINTGKPQPTFPLQLKKTNGEKIWVRVNEAPITENGETVAIVGSLTDITEQKELQNLLTRTNSLAKVGSWEIDFTKNEDGVVYWSDMTRELLEVDKDVQPTVEDTLNFIEPSSRNKARKAFSEAVINGTDYDIELLIQTGEGTKRWIRNIGKPEFVNGKCVRVYGSFQDIHERKISELKLQDRNSFIETVLKNLPIGISVHEAGSGKNIWMNEKFSEIYGWPKEKITDIETFFDKVYPDPEYHEKIKSQMLSDIESGDPTRMQWIDIEITTMDGRKKFVDAKNIPLDEQDLMISTVVDVTENNKYKQELRESLELYEYVTKATDDVVYSWDIEQDILEWDDSFREKFLYDIGKGQYTIKHWAQNVHPEDLSETKESLNNILENTPRAKWEQEYRFQRKDGSYATVFERGFIIRNEDGEAVRMIGSLQDITERKKYEEQLEELALVASKTTDIIFMTDPNEKITWVNNAFEEVLGYQFDEVIGKAPGNLLRGPDNKQHKMNRISKAFKNKKGLQEIVLNYSKTGDKYWFDLTLDPIFDNNGDCDGFIGIQKDVTDQIEHQRELRKSVERYDIVSKATSDTIWDLNLETDTIQYNQNIYNMFGYEKQQVKEIGSWWRDNLHPNDRPKVLAAIDKALDSSSDRFQMEYKFKASNGSYKYIYDRAFIVENEEGVPIRIIGAMQNVTQQREEQKWLQLFESAVATTTESVAILDAKPDGPEEGRKIVYINKAFREMTGYDKQEPIGQTLHMLNGPDTDVKKIRQLGQQMNNWEISETELINYKKNGDPFWVYASLAPVKNDDGSYSHWIYVGRDVTDRRNREHQLKYSLKEKETLLQEIHHRVKNNLAVVSGMMQLQAFEESNERFQEKIFASVARIQTMASIHELLYQSESFSNLAFDENIKRLVENIIQTMQTDTKLHVTFDIQPIKLNINQAIPCSLIVNEVITNIIKHAFSEKDDGEIQVNAHGKNEEVFLTIKDNGQGLPEDFNNRESNGTLGLKLIDTLATQLGSEYNFQSTSEGTIFNITFRKSEIKGVGNAFLGDSI